MDNESMSGRQRSFRFFLRILKEEIIKCEDIQKEQYMMYFLCNRAKVWKITEEELHTIIWDIIEEEYKNKAFHLSEVQIQSAMKGYIDKRIISNKRFYEKTGIAIYSETSHTVKDLYKEIVAEEKFKMHVKRVELLKRLVKRKNDVTVKVILEHFEKHGVDISRTNFYNNRDYEFIMSDFYKNGDIKIIKKKNCYVFKLKWLRFLRHVCKQ